MKTILAKKWPQIVLAFAGCAAMSTLLVWMASTVAQGRLLPFDSPVMHWVHAQSSGLADMVFLAVTHLGGVVGVTCMTAIVFAWLLRHRRRTRAWLLVLGVSGAGALNLLLKLLFERTRPDFWVHLTEEASYSFPSGHAMGSAALAFSLMLLAWRTRWRWYVVAAASIYMIVVGVSRMYLGVHYPSDILAGWIVSGVWIALLYSVVYGYTKHKQYRK